jgi:hypothetical protein
MGRADVMVIRQHPQIGSPYLIDLHALNIKLVKDIAFLDGYQEPSLLVLHETKPTWAGYADISSL